MTYNLDTQLGFGKYKGCEISEIVKNDPSYLTWCVSHIENFELSRIVISKINKGKDFLPIVFSEQLLELLVKLKHPLIQKLLNQKEFISDIDSLDITDSIDQILCIKNAKKTPIKFGRFLSKLFVENFIKFSQADIENCVNEYKSILDSMSYEFSLISGSDIKEAYDGEYYDTSSEGPLQSSCMKYKKCRYYLNLYTKNKESIKLLVLKSKLNGKVIGRAIIWNNMTVFDKNKEPIQVTLMDRIYYTKDHQKDLFINYAVEHEMAFKVQQNNDPMVSIKFKNKLYDNPLLYTKVDNFQFEYYPYMDTMYSISENGYLSNLAPYRINSYFGKVAATIFELKTKKGNIMADSKVRYIEARRTDGAFQVRDQESTYETF